VQTPPSYNSYSSYGSVIHPIAPQSVSHVWHCARIRTAHSRPRIFWPEVIALPHACILAGGHRSSVELRPSRNPSSNRRRRCRAGVSRPTHSTALRRCAALSPTTPYSQNLVLIPHSCKFLVFFSPHSYYLCA
jgi:hypothetical protein